MAPLISTPNSLLAFQNPFLPFFSLSPILSQIRRSPAPLIAGIHGVTRRERWCKPPGKEMSVSVQMPTPSLRRERDEEAFVDSRNCKFPPCSLRENAQNEKSKDFEPNIGMIFIWGRILFSCRRFLSDHKENNSYYCCVCFDIYFSSCLFLNFVSLCCLVKDKNPYQLGIVFDDYALKHCEIIN